MQLLLKRLRVPLPCLYLMAVQETVYPIGAGANAESPFQLFADGYAADSSTMTELTVFYDLEDGFVGQHHGR